MGSIVNFGGSVAEGSGCDEQVDNITKDSKKFYPSWHEGHECNYALMLARRLNRTFPANVVLRNLAASGRTMIANLAHVRAVLGSSTVKADLILFDHARNDQNTKKLSVAEKSAESIRVVTADTLQIATCLQPQAQVVLILLMDHDPRFKNFVGIAYKAAAISRGVPLVDVQGVFIRFGKGKIWQGAFHPHWQTHAYVADLFSYRINLEMAAMETSGASERVCVGPHAERGCMDFLNSPPHGCTRPLSAFYASPSMFEMMNIPRVHPRMPVDGSWKLTEDVPGRPGFITTARSNSWIEFPVRFGAVPVLIITFLRSYENIGDAEVRFDNMKGGGEGVSCGRPLEPSLLAGVDSQCSSWKQS